MSCRMVLWRCWNCKCTASMASWISLRPEKLSMIPPVPRSFRIFDNPVLWKEIESSPTWHWQNHPVVRVPRASSHLLDASTSKYFRWLEFQWILTVRTKLHQLFNALDYFTLLWPNVVCRMIFLHWLQIVNPSRNCCRFNLNSTTLSIEVRVWLQSLCLNLCWPHSFLIKTTLEIKLRKRLEQLRLNLSWHHLIYPTTKSVTAVLEQ